jgi:uncharacterized membrane protein YjgN (DUF898 family)
MTERTASKITLLWVVAAVALTSRLFLLFYQLGQSGNGRAAWFSSFTIILAARVRGELSRYRWYWTTLAAIVVLHVPLILFVPWTAKWIPSFLILPFCVIDGIAILAVIQAVESRMNRDINRPQ